MVLLHYSTVISTALRPEHDPRPALALLEQQQREGDENQGTVTLTGGLTT